MVLQANPLSVFSNELHWVTDGEVPNSTAQSSADIALSVIGRTFTRIAQSISEYWGRHEFDAYMEKLLIDERGGRRGFPPEVAEALLRLSRLHAEAFGFGAPNDIWINEELRSKHN